MNGTTPSSLSFGSASIPVIAAPEELDLAAVPRFREALTTATEAGVPNGVVIDMEAVTFIDSRGVAELLALRKRLRGRRVRLVACRPAVAEAMALLGIDILFELHPSFDSLVAHLSSAAG